MKRILIILGLSLLAVFLLLQIDDDLNPDAAQLVDLASPPESSQAYLLLTGIEAAADEDAIATGRMMLDSIRAAEEAANPADQDMEYASYPEDKRLPLPVSELLCFSSDPNCIDYIYQHLDAIEPLIKNNHVLIDRYRRFLTLDDYHTLTRPSPAEPIPAYQALIQANRLMLLDFMLQSTLSEPAEVVGRLLAHFEQTRRMANQQDNLIGKMIFAAQLADSLEVTYAVARKNGVTELDAIPRLTDREKDMQRIFAREFTLMFNISQNMDRHPEFFSEDIRLPGWLIRPFFKPNMSANALLPCYQQDIHRSRMSASEFAQAVAENRHCTIERHWIRNSIGTVLNDVARPDFSDYVGRLNDVDAGILLFNTLVRAVDPADVLDQTRSPYYDEPRPAGLNQDKTHICFDGPLEDTRHFRCLPVVR
jgi:hypothetical protein